MWELDVDNWSLQRTGVVGRPSRLGVTGFDWLIECQLTFIHSCILHSWSSSDWITDAMSSFLPRAAQPGSCCWSTWQVSGRPSDQTGYEWWRHHGSTWRLTLCVGRVVSSINQLQRSRTAYRQDDPHSPLRLELGLNMHFARHVNVAIEFQLFSKDSHKLWDYIFIAYAIVLVTCSQRKPCWFRGIRDTV